MNASLDAYLDIASELYEEDRLDAAMRVVEDAFQTAGWPPGLWTAFYNSLRCEKEARDASDLHTVDESFSIELLRSAPAGALEALRSAAVDARDKVRKLLDVTLQRPILITVFLPDAPVDFIVGSYGYVSHKSTLDKICLPYECIDYEPIELDTALQHEFAHIAAFELGGWDLPAWMDEGLAMYVSGDVVSEEGREIVAEAAREEDLDSVDRVESVLQTEDLTKDAPDLVLDAYYLAGSLVAWWIERRGLASFRDALARIGDGQDPRRAVRAATGMSLDDLEREWRAALAAEGT